MQPGQVERRTHDYNCHGATTLFAALNAKTSEVITQFHQRHCSAQFREFLDLIDARVPKRLDGHIIMDNYSHSSQLCAAVVFNGVVYIVGGSTEFGASHSSRGATIVDRFDPAR